jgi:hypothetical protein
MLHCYWLLPLLLQQVQSAGPPLLLLLMVAVAQHLLASSAAGAAVGRAWGVAALVRWGCETRLQDNQHIFAMRR